MQITFNRQTTTISVLFLLVGFIIGGAVGVCVGKNEQGDRGNRHMMGNRDNYDNQDDIEATYGRDWQSKSEADEATSTKSTSTTSFIKNKIENILN